MQNKLQEIIKNSHLVFELHRRIFYKVRQRQGSWIWLTWQGLSMMTGLPGTRLRVRAPDLDPLSSNTPPSFIFVFVFFFFFLPSTFPGPSLGKSTPYFGRWFSLSKHLVLKILVPVIPEVQLTLSLCYILLHPLWMLVMVAQSECA